ncbi:MAG: rhodanese-like domain-containing protein [Chloroflexota bacterium]
MKKQTNKTRNITIIAIFTLAIIGAVWFTGRPAPISPPLAGQNAGPSLPLEVSVAEAATLVAEGAYLLDVRTPEEWAENHVDGAVLIPVDDLAARLDEVPTGQKIVVMCRSGNRSARGRDILLAAGYGEVTSMAGGINDWISQGYDVVTGP